PLLKVKQQHQDEAARQLAAQEQALADQQARLEALRQYADEYALTGSGSVTNPALLANRLAFRARLDQAIAQQARVVDASRERSDIERTRLLLASRETHVLEKLSASYRADEVRADEQRTQRELDDLGGRRRADGEPPHGGGAGRRAAHQGRTERPRRPPQGERRGGAGAVMAGGVGPGESAQPVGQGPHRPAGTKGDAAETGDFAGLLGEAAPP